LLKISLMGAIVGIVILFLVASEIELSETQISQIDSLPEEEEVLVRGLLTRVTNREKVAFLEVAQEEIKEITVVLFKDREIKLNEGDYVEIQGNVEDYQGEREIIGNRVEIK